MQSEVSILRVSVACLVMFPYLSLDLDIKSFKTFNFLKNFVMGKFFQKLVSEVTSNSSIDVTVRQGHFFHMFLSFFLHKVQPKTCQQTQFGLYIIEMFENHYYSIRPIWTIGHRSVKLSGVSKMYPGSIKGYKPLENLLSQYFKPFSDSMGSILRNFAARLEWSAWCNLLHNSFQASKQRPQWLFSLNQCWQ